MLIADFSPVLGRIFDPKQGGFDRKYYTDGRISAIYAEFKDDSLDLFAEVVDTLIRKFRATPTVEQFSEVGTEIRNRRAMLAREEAARQAKKDFSEGHQNATTSLKAYLEGVVSDPTRSDELREFVSVYGMARVERVLGYQPPQGALL